MKDLVKNNQISTIHVELQKEFIRRRKANPSYSLRAYAQFLEVDQSLLSKIMNKRRSLSDSLIEKLSAKLRLHQKMMNLTTALDPTSAPNATTAASWPSGAIPPPEHLKNYLLLLEDEMNLLENWLHFAVLELIKTKDFTLDLPWMAQRLGVHKKEIEEVLQRLERRHFIEIKGNYIHLLKPNNSWIESIATNEARRELQRNLLNKAKESLDQTSFDDREHTSLTVAIQHHQLPEFKRIMNKFCLNVDAYAQPKSKEEKPDEVYQLTVSFFPLTKIKKERRSKEEKGVE